MILELNRVIESIEKDKGIPRQILIEAIEQAMLSAARKKMGFDEELEARFNEETGEVELFQFKTVAEVITRPNSEMSLADAQKLDPDVGIGDSLGQKIETGSLGRIAAQSAKQVIIQKLRDAERDIIFQEYKDRVATILSGIVRRFEKGNLVVDLGKTEAVIPYRELVSSEAYKPGDRIQAYFAELNLAGRGPQILLSRRHPGLVKSLFEMEVPEISEKIVEIKSVAREPGIRAKVAVYSGDGDVDPVGACVGMRGARVQSIVQELRGEKIDIVLWDEDPARFVCNAIAPAEVAKVIVKEDEHAMEIVVPDDQLSLAIGKKGQNVRLAANLTGWNIDIYSETRHEEMALLARTRLAEELGVDESIAMILYTHAFRSAEEIADVGLEEFLRIPGMDEGSLRKIFETADRVTEEAYRRPNRTKKFTPVSETTTEAHVKVESLEDVVAIEAGDKTVLKRKAVSATESESAE